MPDLKTEDRILLPGVVATLVSRIRHKKFALAAFLIPLGIRAIPEVIVGPYPVGFDTISFYVPNTLDWAAGKTGAMAMLGAAPLMYMISVPLYLLVRVNPVWIFKVMGPILYGGLIWSLFRFLQLGLRWTGRQAFGTALMASLYFVTLRISWDLYRNMLGLTFILLSLPLLQAEKNPRRELVSSVLLSLAVASDQLTAVLALGLIGFRFLESLRRRQWGDMAYLTRVGLAPLALFAAVFYTGLASGISLVETQPEVPRVEALVSSVGFLIYAFFPLLPLAVIGMRRLTNFDLKAWMALCTAIVLVALMPFFGFIVPSYRWVLLLDIPMCVYGAMGFSRLSQIAPLATARALRIFGKVIRVVPILLVFSAILYIDLPAQQATGYYAIFPSFVPTSMMQDNVPLSDMPSLATVLGWVAAHLGPHEILIAHQTMYGWAKAYLPSTANIIDYVYSSPLVGVSLAQSYGYSTIWTVWWVPGLGWHGQAYLPNGFVPIFQDGNMAVYAYQ